MPKIIFSMLEVSKSVSQNQILKDISLSFYYGAKIGVLGLNGSGKSTLLRIIAGEDPNYNGDITFQKGLSFGYLPQEPQLDESLSVKENVEQGVGELKSFLTEFDEISMKMAEPMSDDALNTLMERQGELQEQIDTRDGWELDRKLDIAADALRLPAWDTNVAHLSGGEKRRIALCKLLLSAPDVLLLDEPTNHLDAESVAWLETYLHRFPGTVIAVTHDRYFLDNVAGWILELDRGRGFPFEGNYSSWLEQKEVRLTQEAREESSHQKAIKSELEWVRTNPKGRRKKNKSRLQDFENLSAKEFQKRNETNSLYIPPGERLGADVIKLDNVEKSFDSKMLISDLSLSIPRGAIVGIIGPNGAGKSTFFKMITKDETPSKGDIRIGETVQLGYVDQSRDSLDDRKTVWEEVADGLDEITVGNFTMNSRAYVSRFNFKGTSQQKLVGSLSGGERNRVHLAKLLRTGANVLLLDEPTNDLDVETLRALEEAILAFPGCILVISHDRWFLDRVATHILAFEGDSNAVFFEGSYTDYEENRQARLGEAATQPHRIQYREIKGI